MKNSNFYGFGIRQIVMEGGIKINDVLIDHKNNTEFVSEYHFQTDYISIVLQYVNASGLNSSCLGNRFEASFGFNF